MAAITRRTLLALTGCAVVVDPVPADAVTSRKLQALIAAHEMAYTEFHRVFHQVGSNRNDREQADRVEQGALLALCSFQVISREDRRAKSKYLLAVEARGELDLQEHMRAILYSML